MKRLILFLLTLALFMPSVSFAARGFETTSGTTTTDNVAVASYVGTTQRSVSVQFYVNALDATGRRFWDAGTNDLGLVTSTKINYFVAWSGTDGDFTIAQPSTGVWHSLVITYDGSSTSNIPIMYLDGVSQTVTTAAAPTGTIDNATAAMVIGNNASAGGIRGFNGMLAEFARWNVILTQANATALAAGARADSLTTAPTVYWKLCGQVSPEPNEINGGGTGTVTGALVQTHPFANCQTKKSGMHR